jgi:hypothetical protein
MFGKEMRGVDSAHVGGDAPTPPLHSGAPSSEDWPTWESAILGHVRAWCYRPLPKFRVAPAFGLRTLELKRVFARKQHSRLSGERPTP